MAQQPADQRSRQQPPTRLTYDEFLKLKQARRRAEVQSFAALVAATVPTLGAVTVIDARGRLAHRG